jgi:uncharacterized phage-associated protein
MTTTTNGTAAMRLAHHVLAHTSGVDHLKLQKLCFYAYGAAIALSPQAAGDLGEIEFEPWKHGPVSRVVWDAFKTHKAEVIPPPVGAAELQTEPLRTTLNDALDVYGSMTSWAIRCESHLEEPWLRARAEGRKITNDEIRTHFVRKFERGNVTLPSYLAGAASSALDGIPTARFESLGEMARALRSLRQTQQQLFTSV